ncbi:TetR/AcrR family transcriptional regulator [Candidatus Villigracilis affinis]|jgi:AcrR family transcriptional regulator|uniref:TetR/AcrR family transcriptional regulator n=1 Tax=Candidatus Villigracilis affinis TaxID=3140682 RepID=UPI001B5F3873|nr:TetR family transcriptional regulator [Anaerolineales bacterium]MBP8047869.1 TetR family transcriptional regulator [Anaerolineales bacterium]
MTRDDILDAAAQVFRQKGFHGASMSDIASALDVQKASLYHHVKSKQEILLALLDRALIMLTDHIASIAAQAVPADQKLRQMIRGYLSALSENTDLTAVLLFEHRSLDKKSHSRHVPQRDTFEALWRDVINEGVRSKVFDLKDTGLAVRALMGVMNWTLTWYHPDGGKSIEQIADDYSDFVLKGMLR